MFDLILLWSAFCHTYFAHLFRNHLFEENIFPYSDFSCIGDVYVKLCSFGLNGGL